MDVAGGRGAAVAGPTTRVAVASAGAEANSSSSGPSISANGWLVAFDRRHNLVPGDTNETKEPWRRTGQLPNPGVIGVPSVRHQDGSRVEQLEGLV